MDIFGLVVVNMPGFIVRIQRCISFLLWGQSNNLLEQNLLAKKIVNAVFGVSQFLAQEVFPALMHEKFCLRPIMFY